jgi:hypothetical protein
VRKFGRLAAASTLAAVGMVGASAGAADAHSGHGEPGGGTNICGNSADQPVVSSDEGGDSAQNGESRQIICQNGQTNYAITHNETNVIDGDMIQEAATAIDALVFRRIWPG